MKLERSLSKLWRNILQDLGSVNCKDIAWRAKGKNCKCIGKPRTRNCEKNRELYIVLLWYYSWFSFALYRLTQLFKLEPCQTILDSLKMPWDPVPQRVPIRPCLWSSADVQDRIGTSWPFIIRLRRLFLSLLLFIINIWIMEVLRGFLRKVKAPTKVPSIGFMIKIKMSSLCPWWCPRKTTIRDMIPRRLHAVLNFNPLIKVNNQFRIGLKSA